MRIDCYISQGCGSEEALKENIARALEAEKIHAEVGINRISNENTRVWRVRSLLLAFAGAIPGPEFRRLEDILSMAGRHRLSRPPCLPPLQALRLLRKEDKKGGGLRACSAWET